MRFVKKFKLDEFLDCVFLFTSTGGLWTVARIFEHGEEVEVEGGREK